MELWDVYDENRNPTGRLHERGKPMRQGDYHIVVNVWIQNSKGEYLISKRTPNKDFGNLWECTGGSAVTMDTSLDAALREVKEELGISLDPSSGIMIFSERRKKYPDFCDVWFFRTDVDINEVVFQEGETCDAKWVTPDDIRSMLKNGEFIPVIDYLEEMFARMTKVYFIRHAESDYKSGEDRIRTLTTKGYAAADALVERFKGIDINCFYSSPYMRAVHTIEPIAKERGLDIITIEDLRERKIDSVWIEDFETFSRQQWEDFNYKLTDGECLSEVQKRNIGALQDILKTEKGRSVAIGTHGTALSVIINFYNTAFRFEDFRRIVPILPYVIRLDFLDDKCIGMVEL